MSSTPPSGSRGKFTSRSLKRPLIALGVLLVVAGLIFYGHSQIQTDLHYALTSASAQLSPVLGAYDTAGEFNGREVLELTRPEIQQAVKSWPSFSAAVYLQVFNIPEKALFDSRQGRIRSYEKLSPVSSVLRHGSWEKEGPFFYIDWNPSPEARWILRAAVTPPSYFSAHAWRLLPLLVLLGVIGRLASIQIEVHMRRRFDRLVSSMPVLLRQAQAEDTLIREVPSVIAHMLDFDSVAVYFVEGNNIVPKAHFAKTQQDREAWEATAEPISIQADNPESVAIRENKSLTVFNRRALGAIRPFKDATAASRPYVIVPIHRGEDGKPVGLLTAQHHAGKHRGFLESCAEVLALLLDNVRSRETLRRMIRNTRTETVGTVVSSITHNMKNQLIVVDGLSQSLRNDLVGLSQSELASRTAQIKLQTDLCFQLIDSISQYNRLGKAPNTVVALRQGLEIVFGLYREYFMIENVELVANYQQGFEPSIRMEELDFVQVIENLLINAHDAFLEMRKKRDLRMSRADLKIEVTLDKEDNKARVSIADNGPGISEEDLPRVFEEHFTTKELGTGVGLPFCRRVVEEAGGNIEIDSSYGIGTIVSIFLPIINGELK